MAGFFAAGFLVAGLSFKAWLAEAFEGRTEVLANGSVLTRLQFAGRQGSLAK